MCVRARKREREDYFLNEPECNVSRCLSGSWSNPHCLILTKFGKNIHLVYSKAVDMAGICCLLIKLVFFSFSKILWVAIHKKLPSIRNCDTRRLSNAGCESERQKQREREGKEREAGRKQLSPLSLHTASSLVI